MTWRTKLAVAVGVMIMLGMLWFALARPVQVLPLMGPVATFELMDERGEPFRLHEQTGRVGVYTFGATRDEARLREAARLFNEFAAALKANPEQAELVDLIFVTIDGDYDTPERLAAIRPMFQVGHDMSVRFLTGSWVALRLAVGTGFGVYYETPTEEGDATFVYEPTVAIVDWNGVLRARYGPDEVSTDILIRDMGLLSREFNAQGAQAWVYAGAHLFLCYPR